MIIGVVSDTHNNLTNIDKIIGLFNERKVDLVVHTGDIASSVALDRFEKLNCDLIGVFGNNDRNEKGLKEIIEKNNFRFKEPPFSINIDSKIIVIFHEPDHVDRYLMQHNKVDIVLHGHTHRYRHEHKGETIIFNPGESAGIMKGKNAIGIIDSRDMTIKRIFF